MSITAINSITFTRAARPKPHGALSEIGESKCSTVPPTNLNH